MVWSMSLGTNPLFSRPCFEQVADTELTAICWKDTYKFPQAEGVAITICNC